MSPTHATLFLAQSSTPIGPNPPTRLEVEPDPAPETASPAAEQAPADALPGDAGEIPFDGLGDDVTGSEAVVDRPWWDLSTRPDGSKSLVPGMVMAFGVLVLVFVMMRRVIRRAARRPPVLPPEERLSAIHERAASSITPLEKTMSDAEQLARRLAATMDNKADRIELLIQEADRKLEQLTAAMAQASRSTPATGIERPFRPGRSIDPSLMDRARVEQDREERGGRPAVASAETAPTAADGRATPDPVHRRVWALADDGMPAIEIARSLNQPVGQVELILNLRKSG